MNYLKSTTALGSSCASATSWRSAETYCMEGPDPVGDGWQHLRFRVERNGQTIMGDSDMIPATYKHYVDWVLRRDFLPMTEESWNKAMGVDGPDEHARQMALAEKIMEENREVLKRLADD